MIKSNIQYFLSLCSKTGASSVLFSEKSISAIGIDTVINIPYEIGIFGVYDLKQLQTVFSSMKSNSIEIEEKNNKLTIKDETTKIKVSQIEKDPFIPEYEGEFFPIPNNFLHCIEKAYANTLKNTDSLNKSCIHITKEHIESCTNTVIYRGKLESNIQIENFCLHRNSVNSLIEINPIEYSIVNNESGISFRNKEGIILTCTIYNHSYPNLDRFFRFEDGCKIKIADSIRETLKQAKNITTSINLKILKDKTIISCSSSGMSFERIEETESFVEEELNHIVDINSLSTFLSESCSFEYFKNTGLNSFGYSIGNDTFILGVK